MKPVELKVARIGNSRGVRLPAGTLARYGIGETVLMEELEDGILLRPRSGGVKLSWAETAKAMAGANEDWTDWDPLAADGADGVPWDAAPRRKVAEQSPRYSGRRKPV